MNKFSHMLAMKSELPLEADLRAARKGSTKKLAMKLELDEAPKKVSKTELDQEFSNFAVKQLSKVSRKKMASRKA